VRYTARQVRSAGHKRLFTVALLGLELTELSHVRIYEVRIGEVYTLHEDLHTILIILVQRSPLFLWLLGLHIRLEKTTANVPEVYAARAFSGFFVLCSIDEFVDFAVTYLVLNWASEWLFLRDLTE